MSQADRVDSCCDHLAINIQEQVKDEMEKTVFVLEEWLRIMEGAKVRLTEQADRCQADVDAGSAESTRSNCGPVAGFHGANVDCNECGGWG